MHKHFGRKIAAGKKNHSAEHAEKKAVPKGMLHSAGGFAAVSGGGFFRHKAGCRKAGTGAGKGYHKAVNRHHKGKKPGSRGAEVPRKPGVI